MIADPKLDILDLSLRRSSTKVSMVGAHLMSAVVTDKVVSVWTAQSANVNPSLLLCFLVSGDLSTK